MRVVIRSGFLTSVQDLGRTGFRQFGVSTSGALDSFALRVANLLVGNDEGAAGLEITLGGLQLRFEDERAVAWCGGEFDVQIGSRALPAGHVARLQTGDELKFGGAQFGCRCWLAISGGIDVPVVISSRSTDLRANFGGLEGRALRDGDVLPLRTLALGITAASYRNFLVDGTTRLGESGKPSSEFAFRSWRGLDSLRRCNDSTIHESRIRRFTRFRSYGRTPRQSGTETQG